MMDYEKFENWDKTNNTLVRNMILIGSLFLVACTMLGNFVSDWIGLPAFLLSAALLGFIYFKKKKEDLECFNFQKKLSMIDNWWWSLDSKTKVEIYDKNK